MEDQELKEQYQIVMDGLKEKINSENSEKIILKIENIDEELKEYDKNLVSKKVILGISALGALLMTTLSIPFTSVLTSNLIAQIIGGLIISGTGLSFLADSIEDYLDEIKEKNNFMREVIKEYGNVSISEGDNNVKNR